MIGIEQSGGGIDRLSFLDTDRQWSETEIGKDDSFVHLSFFDQQIRALREPKLHSRFLRLNTALEASKHLEGEGLCFPLRSRYE